MLNYWPKSLSIRLAVNALHKGEVIAYPTEAVWGLGCDPFDVDAVYNILELKGRSVDKGLILIASDISQLEFILKDLSTAQRARMKASWPGPTTWIVPNNGRVPYWVSGNHSGVAVRVTDHPLVQALCKMYGGPIVSTSANPQGKPAAKYRWQVERYFGHASQLTYITKGIVGKRDRPSDIIDLLSESVIR